MDSLPPPPPDYASRVPYVPEAVNLVLVGPDYLQREAWLTPEAKSAWFALREAAAADGIELLLISAFRSIQRQTELVSAKLARGMTIAQALEYSAYPGFSEHHSGNAIDIGTSDCPHLEEEFENTAAFAWLNQHAAAFGFKMTYPRDNSYGIAYEPWHWCHHKPNA